MFGRTLQALFGGRYRQDPRALGVRPPHRRKVLFETLEQRLLLSADPVTAAAHIPPALVDAPASIVAHRQEDQPPAPSVQAGQPTHEVQKQASKDQAPPARPVEPDHSAASDAINNAGPRLHLPALQPVAGDASAFSGEVFYLDIDGANDVLYDGPVEIDGIDVPVYHERDPDKALVLLKEAQQGSAAIRTIPSDGLFYLGRAQQMSGNFNEAIESYNLYTEQVGKKIAKETLTPQFIQECNERKGRILPAKTLNAEIIKRDSILPVINEKDKPPEKIVNHKPDTIVKEEKSLPERYEKQLNEALNYQFRADSLLKLADRYRKQSENAPIAEKASLKTKISEIERLAAVNQKLANDRMVDGSGVMKDTLSGKNEEPLKTVTQKVNSQVLKDTTGRAAPKEKIMPAKPKPPEIYSLFEIVAKPVYAANEKVPVNPDIPAGLIYRIQVAVFRNPWLPLILRE